MNKYIDTTDKFGNKQLVEPINPEYIRELIRPKFDLDILPALMFKVLKKYNGHANPKTVKDVICQIIEEETKKIT